MLWLLDHWWIANAVPYFAANEMIARTCLDPSDDPGSDARWRWGLRAIGVWIVLFTVTAAALVDFDALAERMVRALSRYSMRIAVRGIVYALFRAAAAVAGLLILYVIIVAGFRHRPSRFEMGLTLVLIGIAAGAAARKRR